ncbi:hypothetical protein DFQ03_2118 [Maribacter caenipelagi]|uniref:Uncharacterized protein n=1 Tax=Maribacter caenipelagi TaxID=1447781 RepID=A0A4R7D4N0_9FLAO|nr:hypothetical protein DFQ03_2118 [Maribacter caenipelagi]
MWKEHYSEVKVESRKYKVVRNKKIENRVKRIDFFD